MSLIRIEEPRARKPSKFALMDAPVFQLGFRPFYLLAAAFAALSIPLWMAHYFGWTSAFSTVNLMWHMHEMVFGFAIAVIVGFLYTAGRNWTGLWTPRKTHLAALAALWVAGRIAMLSGQGLVAMVIDGAFLPVAAWSFYRVLKRSDNTRNLFLVGLLGLLTLSNLAFHAAMLGWLSVSPVKPIHAAILIIVMIESVIAGRVIPGFTANAVQGAKPYVNPRQAVITMAVTALACIAWVAGLPAPLTASLAMAAACSQLVRLAGWKPYTTLRHPLLWILHLSYAWIPFGFVLLALSAFNLVSVSAAFHVLTVGSMAGLIIGMITRTALGHTGRALHASHAEVAMYILIQVGVVARLVAASNFPALRNAALIVTTVAWSLAFLVYLMVYTPYLMRPRIDGREG